MNRVFIIFILLLSTGVFASNYDNMSITKTEEGVSVSITDLNSKKLGTLFPAYGENSIIVRLSEAEDIAFRCTKRLSITLCNFTFVSSENIDVGTNISKVYTELNESSVLKTNQDVSLFFRNQKGETFELEITHKYFAAKIRNR
jgi:hypothetical protein